MIENSCVFLELPFNNKKIALQSLSNEYLCCNCHVIFLHPEACEEPRVIQDRHSLVHDHRDHPKREIPNEGADQAEHLKVNGPRERAGGFEKAQHGQLD